MSPMRVSCAGSHTIEQLAIAKVRASSLDIVYIVAGMQPYKLGWQLFYALNSIHCG